MRINEEVGKFWLMWASLRDVWRKRWGGQTGGDIESVDWEGGGLRVPVINWPARRAACLWGRSPAGSRLLRPAQTGWAARSACRHSSLCPILLPEPAASSSTAPSCCSSRSWLQLCNPQGKPPNQASVFNLLFSHREIQSTTSNRCTGRRNRGGIVKGVENLPEADWLRRKFAKETEKKLNEIGIKRKRMYFSNAKQLKGDRIYGGPKIWTVQEFLCVFLRASSFITLHQTQSIPQTVSQHESASNLSALPPLPPPQTTFPLAANRGPLWQLVVLSSGLILRSY